MTLVFILLFVHFVADFYLQRESWIQCKILNKWKSIGLFKHIVTHVILTFSVVFVFSSASIFYQFIAGFIIVASHYMIDIWKTYQRFSIYSFAIDQSAHILILILVGLWLDKIADTSEPALAVGYINVPILLSALFIIIAYKPTQLTLMLLKKEKSDFNE